MSTLQIIYIVALLLVTGAIGGIVGGIFVWLWLATDFWPEKPAQTFAACSTEAEKCCGKTRSPKWPAVRKAFLEAHPKCEGCGGTDQLEAHHKHPFHLHPELELEPSNLITLCEHPSHDCHFHCGHLLSWPSFNVAVVSDAKDFLKKVRSRP